MNTESFVTFRFIGDNLEPEEITRKLKIKPTSANKRGEPVRNHPGRRYPATVWTLDSSLSPNEKIEIHIERLLNLIEKRRKEIQILHSRGIWGELFCSFYSKNGNRIELNSTLLSRISSLNLKIIFDIYPLESEHNRNRPTPD